MTLATRTVDGNSSGSFLRRPKIVVMHASRSGRDWTDAEELGSTLSWFVNPSGASAHWVLSELERVRVVLDTLIAWHSAYLNGRSWGVELTQPTIDRAFTDGHYANASLIGRHYVSLGVAPVWLDYWDGGAASGFVAHQDTKQGRESGKTDPGPEFDKVRFISSLEDGMPTLDEIRDVVREENDKQKVWMRHALRGVLLGVATGQLNSTLKPDAGDWKPPRDLGDVMQAIAGIQAGSGLTEEETIEAVQEAARRGTG